MHQETDNLGASEERNEAERREGRDVFRIHPAHFLFVESCASSVVSIKNTHAAYK